MFTNQRLQAALPCELRRSSGRGCIERIDHDEPEGARAQQKLGCPKQLGRWHVKDDERREIHPGLGHVRRIQGPVLRLDPCDDFALGLGVSYQ